MSELFANPIVQIGLAVVFFMFVKRMLGGERITGEEARSLVDGGALLVDVRTPGEFGGGHIKGALNIPVGELAHRADELPTDKNLVLYCRSGARSGQAVRMLKSRGYTTLHNLGPMHAW